MVFFDPTTFLIIATLVLVILTPFIFVSVRLLKPGSTPRAFEADIDFRISGNKTIFSANTPAGETRLGGPTLIMTNNDARAFIKSANQDGLSVQEFAPEHPVPLGMPG